MEIKINKSFFIKLVAIIILCITCFCAGRFIRFRGISESSQQLESGIVLAGSQANSIIDGLVASGYLLESSKTDGRAILNAFEKLQRSNEKFGVCIEEVIRTTESFAASTENFKSSYGDYAESINFALDLAIHNAEQYEALISKLQQITRNNSEDIQ